MLDFLKQVLMSLLIYYTRTVIINFISHFTKNDKKDKTNNIKNLMVNDNNIVIDNIEKVNNSN